MAPTVSMSPQAEAPGDPIFTSYSQLTRALLAGVTGICLLDGHFRSLGGVGPMSVEEVAKWVESLDWKGIRQTSRRAASIRKGADAWLTALPMESRDGLLLGVLCVLQLASDSGGPPDRHAALVAGKLKPALDCLHRELAAREPERARIRTLTERTLQLEWLFKTTSELRGAADERQVIEELLRAATERLESTLGVLLVPDRRLSVEHERDGERAPELRTAWSRTRAHLITWVQRHHRPLVMNGAGRAGKDVPRCKILCAPVMRETGRVIGVLAFFNPPEAADYAHRHTFLIQHLSRQTAGIVDAQFDLMTGLYTREGLEQMYARLPEGTDGAERSVVYVDVDQMHVVNELHGFELGNELIVRVADVIGPPQLPDGALAARISGDRFAVVLPESDTRAAQSIAERLQEAIGRLVIGPVDSPIEVSVSCGVAALVSAPQALARALAAAELACKKAKSHGRHRVELYACGDASMTRRHDDVVAVGQLRSALKADRLLLYAQRIVPLRDRALLGGYEILMRMRTPEGALVLPGPLIKAAERYQLLPSIDRWVARRALQVLAPFRNMIRSRGITLSINLSGQSIGDEELGRQLAAELQAANLPVGCLMLEITEQAAVASLARANEMIQRLDSWGCRFALDDFGTGSNSLSYLKGLRIARVKIDGSFVSDILTNPRSEATVRGIVELARGFSIDTVAEFVENEAIADKVRALGVDYAQGYAFGKPEPLEPLLAGLARDESHRLHRLFLEM